MKKFFDLYLKHILIGAIIILAFFDFIIWLEIFKKAGEPELAVYFFDVGQGDSEFISAKDGTQILIDGGPSSQVLADLAEVMPYYDHSIDMVILTHPHLDHVAGLLDVLDRYDIGEVIESGVDYNTAEAHDFEKLISEKNIKKIIVDRPMSLSFFGGAVLKFLYPDISYEGETLKNVHDSAIVSELDFEGKKILFMADAEKKTEDKLLAKGVLDDVDVLKVGHHGSKTSSNQEFLKAIRPEYAVISVGRKNRYGHPNQEALSRLASAGAEIFRTDLQGTVELAINNGALYIKSEK